MTLFVASARQLAKALEVPLVNDLGYTKRYVRCLQISEVVNSMKDLIDYSRDTGTGPMESLVKFPQRNKPGVQQPQQNETQLQQQQQQTMVQNTSNHAQAAVMQLAASNGMPSTSNTVNSTPATSSTSAMAGLLCQNSFNARHQNPNPSANSPYGGNGTHSPTPSSSNNPLPAPHGGLSGAPLNSPNVSMQQTSTSGDADANDSQSSVQKILHDMMMTSQLGSGNVMGMGTMSGNMKNVNGMLPTNNSAAMNGIRSLVANGSAFGNMSNGHSQSTLTNGVRGNNTLSMNGRVGSTSLSQQQEDLSNQLLNGLGTVNGFNDLQFDWKSSP